MDPILIGAGAVAALIVLVLLMNQVRNRRFTKEAPVFRASRWTRGNHVWPTQVAVFPTQVVRYTPRLFGHFEETIAIHQVASVSIDAGLLFADVIIETSGGSQPIRCHGHGKGDAREMQRLISDYGATPTTNAPLR